MANLPYLASYIFSMYFTWGKCMYERVGSRWVQVPTQAKEGALELKAGDCKPPVSIWEKFHLRGWENGSVHQELATQAWRWGLSCPAPTSKAWQSGSSTLIPGLWRGAQEMLRANRLDELAESASSWSATDPQRIKHRGTEDTRCQPLAPTCSTHRWTYTCICIHTHANMSTHMHTIQNGK